MAGNDVRSSDNVIYQSASDLADRVKSGELSAEEVVEAHIGRIRQIDPALNALVIPLFDEARAQARLADEKRARGEPLGKLHGVPVTIKEQYKVKGTQVTLGATNKIGNVYDNEGPVVTKLRAEGAIILGKTNIVQTLMGYEATTASMAGATTPGTSIVRPGAAAAAMGPSSRLAARRSPWRATWGAASGFRPTPVEFMVSNPPRDA